MQTPLIQLDGAKLALSGNAGRIDVIRGVNLEVFEKDTIALLGPSGSGKSSLLMLIGGLERATGGAARVCGQDLGEMNEDELAAFRQKSMGIVFQSFHLIPTMTALENVASPLEFAGAKNAFETAERELAAVGLESRLHHYPSEMSGGEQQRVALARAMAPRPKILLADEPTGNLDEANGKTVADLIFGMCKEHGLTLVLVTHSRRLAKRCARVVRLRDGQIDESQSPGLGP